MARRATGAAVVMDGPKITGVLPASDLCLLDPTRTLPDGTWLAPGFIDVQVNGGGDVLFNDEPTVTASAQSPQRIADLARRRYCPR